MSAAQQGAAEPHAKPKGAKKRKRMLTGVALVVIVAALAFGTEHFVFGARYESTDNAYVQGNIIQITPQIAGTVLAIEADDTDFVKAGQTLVRLDPADARVALDQAEAQLAQTVREVRTLYANNATLKAQVALRDAEIARVQSDVQRAQDDLARRQPLLATGAVGKEEFNHATAQLNTAKSVLAAAESAAVAAREQLAANQVMTEGTTVEDHPTVQRAAARVREAWLALKRVELPAPVDGTIARRSVQLGQRVQPGAPLMSLVPLNALWVDANFKESQLRKLRIDQPVTLVADVYGKQVEYHGRVVGLGAGTGSAFALLPAQNATGNWIKVVQRVPVRVALDPKELAAHPLRIGLSMVATVDVRDQNGKTLTDTPRADAATQTAVFEPANGEADAVVRKIIAAQLGRPVPPRATVQTSRRAPAGAGAKDSAAVAAAADGLASAAAAPLR